jgi:hypothetical protein
MSSLSRASYETDSRAQPRRSGRYQRAGCRLPAFFSPCPDFRPQYLMACRGDQRKRAGPPLMHTRTSHSVAMRRGMVEIGFERLKQHGGQLVPSAWRPNDTLLPAVSRLCRSLASEQIGCRP